MLDEESGNNLEHKEQSDRHNQTVGDLPPKNPEIKYKGRQYQIILV